MKSNSGGEVLIGSPGSEARIIQTLQGLNRLFWSEGTIEEAISYIASCEMQELTTELLSICEFRNSNEKIQATQSTEKKGEIE